MNDYVKKIVARNGSREEIICDETESNLAIVYGEIKDFKDETIICIKYLFSDNPDFIDAEETNWFINSIYAERFIKPLIVEDEIESHEQHAPFSKINDVYTIYSDFIPEVLLFEIPNDYDLFEAFDRFYMENLDAFSKRTFNELLEMFVVYLKNYTDF